jgi:hypothetical protein
MNPGRETVAKDTGGVLHGKVEESDFLRYPEQTRR